MITNSKRVDPHELTWVVVVPLHSGDGYGQGISHLHHAQGGQGAHRQDR